MIITKYNVCIICGNHYDEVILNAIASQITSLTIVYSIVYSDVDQRKHQSSASLAFVWGIHRGPVNSPHKRPVTRKMFPFDDVIMTYRHHARDKLSTRVAFVGWIPFRKFSYEILACCVVVSLNNPLNKQSSCLWFETPWGSCDITHVIVVSSEVVTAKQKKNISMLCSVTIHMKKMPILNYKLQGTPDR